MKIKHLHLIIAMMLFVGLGNWAMAQTTFTEGDIIYHVWENVPYNAVGVDGHVNGPAVSGSINIPRIVTHDGVQYMVKQISSGAFQNCQQITSVTFPPTLQRIDTYAFEGCTGITGRLTIPNSVVNIYYCAFQGCSGITELVLSSDLCYIGDYAFAGCTGLVSVTTKVDEPFIIQEHVFEGVPNIPLYIPFDYYDEYAASSWGSIFSLIIPTRNFVAGNYEYTIHDGLSTVTVTGHKLGTALPDYGLNIPDVVTHKDSDYTVTEVGEFAFYGSWAQGSIIIPNSVTNIGMYAFAEADCEGNLILGNSLVEIGQNAFDQCYNLTGDLVIPNSVTTIGDEAFWALNYVESILIGENVNSIGYEAFAYVGASILNFGGVEILATTPPALGSNPFNGVPATTITVPCGYSPIYQAAWGSVFATYVENCSSVEEAGENTASVYPNPSNGLLKIEVENLRNISIFNAIGQKVYESPVSGNAFEYNFGGSTGMFLIKVETDKGVETKKVTVM